MRKSSRSKNTWTNWNGLGWVDPFSSDAATIRQYAFAEVIGRAANQKKGEVNVAVADPAPVGTQILEIKIGRLPNPTTGDKPEVWMAISETGLHSDVKRGKTQKRTYSMPQAYAS